MPRASMELGEHVLMAFRMPCVTEFSASSPNALGVVSAKSVAPCSDRLVGHGHPALGHQFLDVAIADGEPKIQPGAVADDFGREAVAAIANFGHRGE